ncbi:MAG: hypothetical protein IPK56_03105 [Elusimicrobia bacterium]|nr:hypothetical protein [Elusimicrobiota bacterium]
MNAGEMALSTWVVAGVCRTTKSISKRRSARRTNCGRMPALGVGSKSPARRSGTSRRAAATNIGLRYSAISRAANRRNCPSRAAIRRNNRPAVTKNSPGVTPRAPR